MKLKRKFQVSTKGFVGRHWQSGSESIDFVNPWNSTNMDPSKIVCKFEVWVTAIMLPLWSVKEPFKEIGDRTTRTFELPNKDPFGHVKTKGNALVLSQWRVYFWLFWRVREVWWILLFPSSIVEMERCKGGTFGNVNPIFSINVVKISQDFWFYFMNMKQVSLWMRR